MIRCGRWITRSSHHTLWLTKNGWVRPLGSLVFGSRSPYMYIHVYTWPKHYHFSKVAILIQEMVFLIIKLFQVEHWWLDKISDYIRTSQIEIDNKKNKIQKVTKSKNIKWSLLQWCWLNRFLLDSSKELDFHLNPPNSTQLRGWGYHEIPPKVCGRYTCILHVMV